MKVITFGEIMLRLAPHGYERFTQANDLQATFGGGEANVAVSLANFGVHASFVSKLPTHDIAQCAINELRRYGVDCTHIVRGGERIGIYYLEKGASQRPSKVIYDRAHSAIACATMDDFDWDAIFDGADWFHVTGITPALGDEVARITIAACKAAKKKGLLVSCDLNYRKKLWSRKKAGEIMGTIMNDVDICIANEEDAADIFDMHALNSDVTKGSLDRSGYIHLAKELQERFHCCHVAITLRESISASENNWSALLYTDGAAYLSRMYNLRIVDRVGGGDSFGAGLIYALLMKKAPQDAIEFATAASCLKHSIEGDFNRVGVEEVEALANGDASGRVQR